MFQIKHGQSPEIVSDIFAQTTQHYNFRQNRDFRMRSVKSLQFPQQFQNRNPKVGTTKLPLQTLQAIY